MTDSEKNLQVGETKHIVDMFWIEFQMANPQYENVIISCTFCPNYYKWLRILYHKPNGNYYIFVIDACGTPSFSGQVCTVRPEADMCTLKLNDDTVTITEEAVEFNHESLENIVIPKSTFRNLLVHMQQNGWTLPYLNTLLQSGQVLLK